MTMSQIAAFYAENPSVPPKVLIGLRTHAAYQRRILEGVIDYVREHEAWEFFFEQNPDDLLPRLSRAAEASGLLIQSQTEIEQMLPSDLHVPIVRLLAEPGSFATVTQDNQAIGRLAFEHLHQLGFGRLAFFSRFDNVVFHARYHAFQAAADRTGLEVIEARGVGDADLADWLDALPQPIGLFAANDSEALKAVNACNSRGIRVPESIAVLGVDDDELICNLATPSISSIDHGMRRLGYEASALLDRLMAGEAPPDQPLVIEPVEVVQRQSTDTLAVADPDLREALRFIRQRACDGIRAADVLDHVPVSRRKLEMGFKRLLRRTVHEEITRVRLARARRLLRETRLALPEIAAASGYRSAARLSEAFRRQFGQTPSAFRRSVTP
jgi:LacI family transcriptional regulator